MIYMANYGMCQVCKRRTCSMNETICPSCARDRDQLSARKRKSIWKRR